MLARYARQVSGTALIHIGRFFEDQGHIAREVARLDSRRAWRRASAVHSLGGMASKSAIPALMEALSDSDRDVAAAAARSLGHLRALDAVEPLVYALVDGRLPRAVSAQALLTIGAEAVPRLRDLLADAPVEVAAFAVDLIGLLGEASDSPQLVALLRDTSAEVRAHAARALGRLAAEDASDELRRALEDRIPFVRVNAAHALGDIRDAFAAPALARQARWDEFDPAEAAARALARVSPEAPPRGGGRARLRAAPRSGRRPLPGRAVRIFEGALVAFSLISFGYFVAVNVIYLTFTAIAWRGVTYYRRAREFSGAEEVFASPLTPPVSILVPAFNEEAGIVESVRSLLALRYPELEVIVVNDGSTDRTLQRLTEAFELVPVRKASRTGLPTAPVARSYASRKHPELWVDRQGKRRQGRRH